MQLKEISEVHLLDDGGYQVVARLEGGSVIAEFRVNVSNYRHGAKKTRKKTLDELTEETRELILNFCKRLVDSN